MASFSLVACRVPNDSTDGANLTGSRLEQLGSIPLAGLVESIAVLRGRSSIQKDALLLTFRSTPTCLPPMPLTHIAQSARNPLLGC